MKCQKILINQAAYRLIEFDLEDQAKKIFEAFYISIALDNENWKILLKPLSYYSKNLVELKKRTAEDELITEEIRKTLNDKKI